MGRNKKKSDYTIIEKSIILIFASCMDRRRAAFCVRLVHHTISPHRLPTTVSPPSSSSNATPPEPAQPSPRDPRQRNHLRRPPQPPPAHTLYRTMPCRRNSTHPTSIDDFSPTFRLFSVSGKTRCLCTKYPHVLHMCLFTSSLPRE